MVTANGIVRYVQLKASHLGGKARDVSINTVLATKPGGCVIWIRFDPEKMALGPYLWFGAEGGLPLTVLGDRVGRHSRGFKADRPGIRVLKRTQFCALPTIDQVVAALFAL